MAGAETTSPRVLSLSWGRMEVAGVGTAKDVKLFPGGGRAWDWNETGTAHEPGILPADVEELLDRGAEAVVLSRGMHGRLGVDPRTRGLLDARSVEVHTAETEEAVRIYNGLARNRPVGGLFHSTC
ncbi:Mth938-like domain-containing protein [Streptomonospora algeriensis]|uniref:Mth938-like domain-containing protein n=1 Tax=Streptomonospora algeriensis TaxID=995084 RepID=A0ABW3BDM7_9ACTN